ncbi:MAG: dihydropteroate synthase [bacterium]
MKLIGENIHIVSPKTRLAIENRDKEYIQNLAKKQAEIGIDWIDLNIGPARRGWDGVMKWLTSIILEEVKVNFSFDTSNLTEMENGLNNVPNPQNSIINSTSGDPERLEKMAELAARYNSNLIALTMSNKTGIPKDPDAKLEIAFLILDKTSEMGIDNSKILMDPLVLPVSVDQSQALEALNAIRVFKESFDPSILTTIGLSNISNGSPKETRSLINRVFAVMAMGCGLDTAIVDSFDSELLRINKIIETKQPEKNYDNLLINLYDLMQDFGDLDYLSYNKDNPEEEKIYKTARIILNKDIYAYNYLDYQ